MKICALSDLHGTLLPVEDIEPCELVCICGDIVPLNIQSNSKKTRRWLKEDFKSWANTLPCDKVLFIAGNHDLHLNLAFMKEHFSSQDKVTYLFHENYVYKAKNGREYTIFGTPYCKQFGNWAYMEADEMLVKLFQAIPKDLDILMTHDAPYGVSDVLLQNVPWNTGEHIGNIPLREAILEKSPRYNIHGHLHSTSHEFENLGITKVVNCSLKDEHYQPVYYPIPFILE